MKENAQDARKEAGDSFPSGEHRGRDLGLGIVGKAFAVMLTIWVGSESYYALGFFAVAMLPAIIAVLIDRSVGRFASKTVSAFNLIGVMPYLFDIAMRYDPTLVAKELLSDGSVWVYVYGFAMVGWMIVWLMPQLTIFVFTMRAESRVYQLEKRQNLIVEEWGEEVKPRGSVYGRTEKTDAGQ